MTKEPIKLMAIIFTVVVVINMILFAFGVISTFYFWFIIILCAFIAYFVIPKLKAMR
ncbi:MAG: hypothetical protein Q7J54_03275 [Candidatus Woesearchaeota archaeon]|nr:hypothetical protein [Candidatus Woesearchaeota archaeon]